MEKWLSKVCYLVTESLTFKIEVKYLFILVYAYDKTNHIFSEIHFGSRKRSLKKTNDPTDFFYGTIYQLKPEFLEKFNQGFPRIYPAKEYIIK